MTGAAARANVYAGRVDAIDRVRDLGRLSRPTALAGLLIAIGVACNVTPRGEVATTAVGSGTPTTADASSSGGAGSGETTLATAVDGTGEKLDVGGGPTGGCQFVDMLFVIDNSQSMQTYQDALADQFPSFVTSMFDSLPQGVDVHVGITTTDFDSNCAEAEATGNCQTSASIDQVLMHYNKPTDGNDGGNGSQGRLFQYAGKSYFAAGTDDDPAPLSEWFSQAAVAAGESGCSFEMPVAAAGWAVDPANDATNGGFLRDENGLLVVFFLTDEPDKSPESKAVYAQQILDAKAGCGGEACVFVSGLVPTCIADVNQKLWQFMNMFGETPPYGDILDTAHYDDNFGAALATAVAEACANVPVG